MLTEAMIIGIGTAAGVIIGAVGKIIIDTIKVTKDKDGRREQEYFHTENLVKLIGGQSQELSEIKNSIASINNKVVELTESEASFNRMYLRHSILRVYFSYEKSKELPEAEWESVLGLYDVYVSLGGNGFVHEKVEEMKGWKKT